MALNILREDVMKDIPRKNGDHLRVVFTKATTEEGKTVGWHSIELGTLSESGEFKYKDRVILRGRELRLVMETLHHACFGDPPPGAQLPVELSSSEDDQPF